MSPNYHRDRTQPDPEDERAKELQTQLADLFETVRRCEAIWAVEDRIEHSLDRDDA